MKYKALIVDVDGTLIVSTPDGVPTKKVIKAMNDAGKKLHVGLATSRCLPNAAYLLDVLKLSGPSVFEGGGCVFDAGERKTISEHVLIEEELDAIQKVIKEFDVRFEFCNNKSEHGEFPKLKRVPNEAFMVFSQGVENLYAKEITSKIKDHGKVAVHTTPSWTKGKTDILITNSQATKQHGILEVAKILGIETHEIIGVGDGNNDFPLLMACGLKVAMGNAGDDLKAIADFVAPRVEDDGLACVIEKFVL